MTVNQHRDRVVLARRHATDCRDVSCCLATYGESPLLRMRAGVVKKSELRPGSLVPTMPWRSPTRKTPTAATLYGFFADLLW